MDEIYAWDKQDIAFHVYHCNFDYDFKTDGFQKELT